MIMPIRVGGEDAFPADPFDLDRLRGRIPLDEEFREGLGCAFRRRNRVPNGARFAGRRPERWQYRPSTLTQKLRAARQLRLFRAFCESAAWKMTHPLQTTIHRWADFCHGTNDSTSRFPHCQPGRL